MFPVRTMPGRPLILGGVAVAALLTGAGAAVAATSGHAHLPASAHSAVAAAASPTPPPAPRWHWAGRMWHMSWAGAPGPWFGGPGAIHGQFVIPKSGGGYQTVDSQRGTVTAVTSTSITVRSGDGFIKTYQVTASTMVDARRGGIGSVKAGNEVAVFATVSGPSATAVSILDVSALPKAPGWQDGPWRW